MAFSYDTALSTARDRVRFYTTDTVAASAVFSNEEIDGLLAVYDELLAAAHALRNRAVYFAARAISFSVGAGNNDSIRVDRRSLPKFYMELADTLEKQAMTTPAEAIDSVSFCIDSFGRDHSEYIGDLDVDIVG